MPTTRLDVSRRRWSAGPGFIRQQERTPDITITNKIARSSPALEVIFNGIEIV
jgi:hypothetical protein